jgi:hypothetical protein
LKLNLADRRLFDLLIAQVDPFDEAEEFPMTKIDVTEYQRINGLVVDGGRAFEPLKRSVTVLLSTVLELPSSSQPRGMSMFQVLTEGAYVKGEGWIKVRLHKHLKPYLCGLKSEFFKHRLEVIGRLHSTYALRLYKYVKSKEVQNVKIARLTIEEMRSVLHVEDGKLSMPGDLQRKAITPAVAGVNAGTDMAVSVAPERGGRGGKIKAFVVTWRSQKMKLAQGRVIDPKNPKRISDLSAAEQQQAWDWMRTLPVGSGWPDKVDWKLLKVRQEEALSHWIRERDQIKMPFA